MSFSAFVFLAILMFSLGYIAQNVRQFNFWKFLILFFLIMVFFNSFGFSKEHLITMFVAFFMGYLLPHASVLRGIGEHLSDFINAIRYKDAWEDIKRKEAEVEELREKYKQARAEANREKQEQARRNRQQQSQNFRQKQKEQKHKSENNNSSNEKSQKSSSSYESPRDRYLKILGLELGKEYSFAEIKKAYRRQASKYHPDKHHGKPNYKEMEERFKKVQEAFERLV